MAETPTHQVLIDTHTHSENHLVVSENIRHSATDLAREVAYQRHLGRQDGKPVDQLLGGFALTGHDTLIGVSEAMEAAERLGVIAIPGVEITCKPTKDSTGPHIIVLLPAEEAMRMEAKTRQKIKAYFYKRSRLCN